MEVTRMRLLLLCIPEKVVLQIVVRLESRSHSLVHTVCCFAAAAMFRSRKRKMMKEGGREMSEGWT